MSENGVNNGNRQGVAPDRSVTLNIRTMLAKAAVLTGRAIEESSAIAQINETTGLYGEEGAVEPPYDPWSLLNYIELTPHLRPCIEAYQLNIEGYGYLPVVVEPWMEELDSDEATAAIEKALQIERWVDEEEAALDAVAQKADEQSSEENATDDPDNVAVTPEDIESTREDIRMRMRREVYIFNSFFKNCCSSMSFTKLRRITRGDIEAHGWGAWEMLRDGYGRLKRLNYIPGYTIRPIKNEGELVEVAEPDPVTPLSEGREVLVSRRFRRYVQIVGSGKSFYKSPSDPRIISRTTGKIYKTIKEMRRPVEDGGEGPNAAEANELIYISLHDPRTTCPPPRWIGNLLSVLGGREADESNYFYLNSNAIPPGILFVSGGKIPRDMKDRLEQRMTAEFSGARNNHKILVVEATPMKMKGDDRNLLPSMQYESLRDAQQNDATFTSYDQRSSDRIGASFRLSPMLRGYTPSNLNRATAVAALAFAESQVFEPEREDIDWVVNHYILPEIGIKFHKFRSNSPPTRSPEEIAQLISVAAPHGGLLPNEIRNLLSDALNHSLADVEEEWLRWPMPMTLAGIGGGGTITPVDGENQEGMAVTAMRLEELRKRVESIVTDQLRGVGMEMDINASWKSADELEVADDVGFK